MRCIMEPVGCCTACCESRGCLRSATPACLLCGQVAFKLLVLDRVLEEDSVTGDAYGPYDPDHVKEERARLRVQKARRGLPCSRTVRGCRLGFGIERRHHRGRMRRLQPRAC